MTIDLNWRRKAICASDDPEILNLFFDDNKVDEAKRICGNCPVRLQCLKDALDTEDRFGVRGGTDETTRRHSQNLDQYGKPTKRLAKNKCPNCTSTDLKTLTTKKVKFHLRCNDCDLSWWARRITKVHTIDADEENERDDEYDDLEGNL